MPTIANGYLRATPMRVTTTATLTQIAAAMSNRLPNLGSLGSGWGSIYDDHTIIGNTSTQPPVSAPTMLPAQVRQAATTALPFVGVTSPAGTATPVSSTHPESLVARLYWYERDSRIKAELGPTVDPKRIHRLRAVDVMISPIDGSPDFTVLVTSLNSTDTDDHAVAQLQQILVGIDGGSTIDTKSSVLDLLTPDFFRWLIHRRLENILLTTDLMTADMRHMRIKDPLDHGTYMWRGVDASRLDLLGHLADKAKTFGPAGVLVRSLLLDATFDFDIYINGAFNAHPKSSNYFDDVKRSKLETRLQIVRDLAFTVIPALKDAYAADTAWNTTIREQYRLVQKNELIRRAQLL